MRLAFNEEVVTLECVECGITFGMTATLEQQLRRSQRLFMCPNGHSQSYKGVLKIEALEKRIEEMTAENARKVERLLEKEDRIAALHRRIATLKGVITRLKGKSK
jgi:hypothetical protein